MLVPVTVILNPYSNRWRARAQRPAVEAALAEAGLAYRLHETARPGDGVTLAREAALAGEGPIVAAGGDGIVGEAVNGIIQANSRGPLGILPLGTANDLAAVLGIPTDLRRAARTIAMGECRTIDLGVVNGRYFANNSGVGLEPVVTLTNRRLTRVRGVLRYVVAAVLTILQHPIWQAHLEWDGGHYEGSMTLVSVGNTHRTGGVFFMTPLASPDDALLDVTFAPALSRVRLFRLLPMTLKGTHIKEPEIRTFRTRSLHATVRPATPIQADGEIVEMSATVVRYSVLPGALQVLVPPGRSARQT
ncbi:MAG: diacylglycerol kinase family lipid kinase [Armatimonadetes bacterium]|nr:diacylglycerol kinase family lipid kinase [Armatimonadota bacterium]